MLQAFPLGHLELFAPSSAEEFLAGYDAKLVGRGSFRELYLQFKAPTYSERHDRFTIRPTPHQHQLLKEYPPNSAFYIVGLFHSLAEFNTHQANAGGAANFLAHFVCIDVSVLPYHIDFFHFSRLSSPRQSLRIAFKVIEDGLTRLARHDVPARGRLRGSTLLTRFKADALGAIVRLDDANLTPAPGKVISTPEEMSAKSEWYPSRSQGLFELSRDCTPSDFGIHLRRGSG